MTAGFAQTFDILDYDLEFAANGDLNCVSVIE